MSHPAHAHLSTAKAAIEKAVNVIDGDPPGRPEYKGVATLSKEEEEEIDRLAGQTTDLKRLLPYINALLRSRAKHAYNACWIALARKAGEAEVVKNYVRFCPACGHRFGGVVSVNPDGSWHYACSDCKHEFDLKDDSEAGKLKPNVQHDNGCKHEFHCDKCGHEFCWDCT